MAAISTSVHSFSPFLTSKPPSPPSSLVIVTSRLSSSSLTSSSRSSISRFLSQSPARRMKAATASKLVCMAPDEEKLTRRNPLDFPVISEALKSEIRLKLKEEWERPKPGRRPDIFPQFSPMKTPLPPPLPYDPPAEDEEEEDEENKEEEEDDPDKEQPENRFRAHS